MAQGHKYLLLLLLLLLLLRRISFSPYFYLSWNICIFLLKSSHTPLTVTPGGKDFQNQEQNQIQDEDQLQHCDKSKVQDEDW